MWEDDTIKVTPSLAPNFKKSSVLECHKWIHEQRVEHEPCDEHDTFSYPCKQHGDDKPHVSTESKDTLSPKDEVQRLLVDTGIKQAYERLKAKNDATEKYLAYTRRRLLDTERKVKNLEMEVRVTKETVKSMQEKNWVQDQQLRDVVAKVESMEDRFGRMEALCRSMEFQTSML